MHTISVWSEFNSFITEWPEVWSLIIPVCVLFIKRKQPAANRYVIRYICAALVINTAIDAIWKFRLLLHDKNPYNGFLYNLHSIIRFLLFNAYFRKLHVLRTGNILLGVFIAFVFANFFFFEIFFDYNSPFSSRLLSIEAGLLLLLCLQYYFHQLKNEEESREKQPDFWIVTGLSIYVTINFFIFLLFKNISQQWPDFGKSLWSLHNVSYIIMNVFFAKAFYETNEQ